MNQRLRFVTAASLFDGHDVSINIMRRMLQAKGVEVIHLGHNRSAWEVVDAALSEDAHAIALSSYQGGHMEYFKYVRNLLDENGARHIRIFGGGGGVITAKEMDELHKSGITRIYGPQDGMKMGLEGIIKDMLLKARYDLLEGEEETLKKRSHFTKRELSKLITFIEERGELPEFVQPQSEKIPVLGITGTGGAGKSSLIDELLLRFNRYFPQKKLALISVDPTKKRTKGALLGDRIRLGNATSENFFVRSLATRDSQTELSPQISKVVSFLKSCEFDMIIVETSGIGQASDAITEIADKCLYVMTPEYGAATQLEKIEMLESADFIALNKYEKPRALDALRDIRKQYRRNHELFHDLEDDELPIYGTMASRFNDFGVNALFKDLVKAFSFEYKNEIKNLISYKGQEKRETIIASDRTQYLLEISKACRDYNQKTEEDVKTLREYEVLEKASLGIKDQRTKEYLKNCAKEVKKDLSPRIFDEISLFRKTCENYDKGKFTYRVRGKDIEVMTKYESLGRNFISRVGKPRYFYDSDCYEFIRRENLPGFFPFSGGIFPFKRQGEDPKRQFAGEGGPKRTNKRFHYLSENDPFKRLSTAFDSVTLYGEDPHERPDIYGKVGESGVSICSLDDMNDLFSGFDLTSPMTSVSKTINGPAPMILAMFLNTAIVQKLGENAWEENPEKCLEVMRQVRGTVQADILKEDQAQNTCIFSLEFALKMMGDVQEYFSQNKIKNYYTVSISGYHIAEAGANPITQLAFTLANGFTYVEYYLSRGLHIDDFCENLSFFFSNGLDPEYSVMGRVARKIWAVVMKNRYGASVKSQKLKYHIQTSGRSLHAQEMDFNDIRTTLQAFLALSDNCNSLHTNAYDEAITTPTEESVRRAMAIQMIINKEFGLNKTDNPLQGSFIIDELCDLVEEEVLKEFERLSERGGVLGAMESMYQRGKIQEESLYYERLKDLGKFPIIGVNTYIADNIDEQMGQEIEMSRASHEEKKEQIKRLRSFQKRHKKRSEKELVKLKDVALKGGNIFEALLQAVRFCSLGEITSVLYEVGGKYRRNM